MSSDIRYRRYLGMLLGACLGLSYGLVSSWINRLVMPGISFYQPPFGPLGNTSMWLLLGAFLGLVTAWTEETVPGIVLGGSVGALVFSLVTLISAGIDREQLLPRLLSLLFLLLPMVGFFVPLVALHRWAINRLLLSRQERTSLWSSLWLPGLLILLLAGIGLTRLHPAYARQEISHMQSMIQSGLRTSDYDALPPPLQAEPVGGFIELAKPVYTLEWLDRDINRFAIPRPPSNAPQEEAVVIARFAGDEWSLVCLYPQASAEPTCKGFGRKGLSTGPVRSVEHPFQVAWDDDSLYRESLAASELGVLAGLASATIYHIDLTLPASGSTFQGSQQVRYVNNTGVPLGELYFRLYPNLYGGRLDVTRLQVGELPVQVALEAGDSLLRLQLPAIIQPGSSLVVQLDFSLQVPEGLGGEYGLFGFQEGVYSLAQFFPLIPAYGASGWPSGVPAPYADAGPVDASYYLVRVTAPLAMQVIASGSRLGNQPGDDTQVLTFAAGPARDFYLAASDRLIKITQGSGVTTINSYAFPEYSDMAWWALKYASTSLRTFEKLFGPYPYRELDVISLPLNALGIEYPGVVGIAARMYAAQAGSTSSQDLSDQTAFQATIVHEVAHQWFYNLVGNDPGGQPWLDESLTQYAVWLYLVDQFGQGLTAQSFSDYWQGCWDRIGRTDVPIGLPAASFSDAQEYTSIIYCRGPLFISELAETMGRDTFIEFMSDYVRRYRWAIATTQDFRSLAEQHCGCDLASLFESWIDAP